MHSATCCSCRVRATWLTHDNRLKSACLYRANRTPSLWVGALYTRAMRTSYLHDINASRVRLLPSRAVELETRTLIPRQEEPSPPCAGRMAARSITRKERDIWSRSRHRLRVAHDSRVSRTIQSGGDRLLRSFMLLSSRYYVAPRTAEHEYAAYRAITFLEAYMGKPRITAMTRSYHILSAIR